MKSSSSQVSQLICGPSMQQKEGPLIQFSRSRTRDNRTRRIEWRPLQIQDNRNLWTPSWTLGRKAPKCAACWDIYHQHDKWTQRYRHNTLQRIEKSWRRYIQWPRWSRQGPARVSKDSKNWNNTKRLAGRHCLRATALVGNIQRRTS